ncbi:hypothetical protein M758_3G056900 [Ceratodon purpureus]|nr:hypothetical protein M758_3G056900 [Ceratodon purpureus]
MVVPMGISNGGMQWRGSHASLQLRGFGSSYQSSGNIRSNMIMLVLLLLSLLACFYVAGRLWEDAETRAYLVKVSHKRKLQLNRDIFHLSVEEQLKALNCKDQSKKLTALEMELTAAKSHGFGLKPVGFANATTVNHRLHAVVGIMTTFGNKFRRDAIRNTWMPKGEALKDLERDEGIIIRFIIGRSANRGDMTDRRLDVEKAEHDDFLLLEDHVESDDSLSLKSKSYFSTAVKQWDSDFYVKVDDDIFVNIDMLGTTLAKYRDTPRVYLGCLKSGEVVSDSSSQWYEPEWWKFGNEKSQYYLHASGQIYCLSKALAQYININSASLHAYKNEDISVGSWMLGLDIEHVDDRSFCCVASLPGSVCATRP